MRIRSFAESLSETLCPAEGATCSAFGISVPVGKCWLTDERARILAVLDEGDASCVPAALLVEEVSETTSEVLSAGVLTAAVVDPIGES